MAGTSKKKAKKQERGSYEKKLAVKGSFLDIMKAAAKDANNKSAAKKETLEEKVDKINKKDK